MVRPGMQVTYCYRMQHSVIDMMHHKPEIDRAQAHTRAYNISCGNRRRTNGGAMVG